MKSALKKTFEISSVADVLKSGDFVIYRPNAKVFTIEAELMGIKDKQTFYPASEVIWQVSRNDLGQVELINFIGHLKMNHYLTYSTVDKALKELANSCINNIYAESARYLSIPAFNYGNIYIVVTLKSETKVISGTGERKAPYEISFL